MHGLWQADGNPMGTRDNTKRRLLAVERMFQSGRPLTVQQILSKLDVEYDIKAKRQTIASDIQELTMFMPISVCRGKGNTAVYQLRKM